MMTNPMERMAEDLLIEVRNELEEDILPFWLSLKDTGGGFCGEVTSDGTVKRDALRGEILYARIIWSFSAACRALGNDGYLSAALAARDWFVSHILDPVFGGVFWSVAPDGTPVDTKKQLYAQAFAIYAFSELYKVTSDPSDLEVALTLFETVEDKYRDKTYGGYVEALSRDFSPLEDMSLSSHDINAGKTMNSHLHLMEAYANLYRVRPEPLLKEALTSLIHLMCGKITGPDGHLRLYFEPDWSSLPGGVSYGHDIETSWLLLESAEATGDPSMTDYVRPYCLSLGWAGNEGLLPDGSMAYECRADGSRDLSRQWWVQAETVVGNLWLWKYHSDPEGLSRAVGCWNWIKGHLLADPDRHHAHPLQGEWFWGTLEDGVSPDTTNPKAGFWKCPYHNTRMCLEVMRLF